MTPPNLREKAEVLANWILLLNCENDMSIEDTVTGIESALLSVRREAIEEAAEIAEEHNGCVDRDCLSNSNCGATSGRQIRALITSEAGEAK